MSETPAIKIENLSVVYNENTPNEVLALNNVSLVVDRGERVLITGGNGSGKSTLLKAIAGFIPVKSGKIFIDGIEVTNWPSYKRAKLISFVHQDPMLGTCPNLTVHENFQLTTRKPWWDLLPYNYNLTDKHKDSMKESGLPLDQKAYSNVSVLSGGQRQALAVCMSLVSSNSILLYDEFTSALDENTEKAILTYTFSEVEKKKATILMIMHDYQSFNNFAFKRMDFLAGMLTNYK